MARDLAPVQLIGIEERSEKTPRGVASRVSARERNLPSRKSGGTPFRKRPRFSFLVFEPLDQEPLEKTTAAIKLLYC